MTRLWQLYQDPPTQNKGHGFDGDIRVYIHNDNGIPGISGAERVMLYKGMRRGGDAIYALDVTDRNDPQLVWTLDSTSPDFEDLGQTWSTPVAVKVDVGGTIRPVLIFGGGYDTGQDAGNYRTDSIGNAIYMVDALTGSLITSAGEDSDHDLRLDDMDHSVPAPVQVIDINRDKLADRIYFGDMGGRVWRIDIFNGNSASNLLEGGMIASVGAADIGGGPATEIRRFYASPDVVPVVTNSSIYLSINLGSGYRAHPLDTTIADEFYSIRDFQVFRQLDSSDYTTFYRQSDLIDVTNLATPVFDSDPGWRLSMVQGIGEKVLGRSVTFDGKILFTSFEPVSAGSNCVAGAGKNRLYKVDVRSGGPKENLDNSIDPNVLTEDDFQEELTQTGIAPDPVVLFPEDRPNDPIVCIGVECDDANFNNVPSRTFWTQDGTQ
jgi:type IV pilus assembly protein PilY1